MITDVACKLAPRRSAEGHPFTEILHTWRENGVERFACSRVNYAQPDTPHTRAFHNQQFVKRRERNNV